MMLGDVDGSVGEAPSTVEVTDAVADDKRVYAIMDETAETVRATVVSVGRMVDRNDDAVAE